MEEFPVTVCARRGAGGGLDKVLRNLWSVAKTLFPKAHALCTTRSPLGSLRRATALWFSLYMVSAWLRQAAAKLAYLAFNAGARDSAVAWS
eukprot:scaffold43864_cov59-Phaeocystis_antarctica.AAC.3